MIPSTLALLIAVLSFLCCLAFSLVYLVDRIFPFSEIKGFKNQKVISRKSGESVLSVSIEQGVPVLRFKKDHMPQLPPDTVQKILQLVAQSHEDFSLAESPKNDQPDENTDEGA